MVGEHYFHINSIRNTYQVRLKMKYNILCGFSGTGKTLLVALLREATRNGGIITLESDVPVYIPRSYPDLKALDTKRSGIVVIDEDDMTDLYNKDRLASFREITETQGHYYLLVTRKPLDVLPYSCKAIYFMVEHNEGKRSSHRLVQRYDWKKEVDINIDSIIVEDSNSGYEFYKTVYGGIVSTSRGNSNLYKYLLQELYNGKKGIMVVGDCSALGSQIDKLIHVVDIANKVYNAEVRLFLPESFEYLVLRSKIFSRFINMDKLKHTENYAETSKFLSWERYYTWLICEESERQFGSHNRYNKSHLGMYYKSDKSISHIKEVVDDLLHNRG